MTMTRPPVVNLAEEVVSSVLQHAEYLQASVVAADGGALEALRWSGALSLVLRDLGVARFVALDDVWRGLQGDLRTAQHAVQTLLEPYPTAFAYGEEEENDADAFIDHLVLFLSGFLWEYEGQLVRLVQLGVVRRLTICSSLSERAHECYDFGAAPSKQMRFDAFAAQLAAHNAFRPRAVDTNKPPQQVTATKQQAEDEWDWTDDAPAAEESVPALTTTHLEAEVIVVHVPLTFAPLLSSKTPQQRQEPSLFVLSHPICATAFPLLLSQVVQYQQLHHKPGPNAPLPPVYSHVRDVQPDHIPSDFRRTLKLVAYTLSEMLVHLHLDAKDRIFAMGATSLKIGHTMLRILKDLQEDLTTHTLQSHQAASFVLIDRTSDLASPCAFGVSLLDRVLALLPQTPSSYDSANTSQTNRKGLHVTEIFPLHGCEPSPLSVSLNVDAENIDRFLPSPFVSGIRWKGGVSLCHPQNPNGSSVFRSLAFRPAKLALRDLDKRLQEVEQELVLARKITKTGSATRRAPGEKKASTRGRDVVLRRISNILDAGEPGSREHTALVELGIVVLETLERMEAIQSRWDSCRERAARNVQLRKQNAGEWIIPELTDTVQRQLLTAKQQAHKSLAPSKDGAASASHVVYSLRDLLTLMVHAFALSSGTPLEDYTVQMIRNVVSDCLLESAVVDQSGVEAICPGLSSEISSYLELRWQQHSAESGGKRTAEGVITSSAASGDEDEDWGWGEQSSPRNVTASTNTQDEEYERLQAKAIVESHVERLLLPLKEVAQLFAKQNDHEFETVANDENSSPRSLLAQVSNAMVTNQQIPELERIVDASEQLTRAGIDLLKSGFSRFGFGGSSGSNNALSPSSLIGDSKVLVIFVVGGITFEEVQEVAAGLPDHNDCQIIIGGTTLTNSEILIEQLFQFS